MLSEHSVENFTSVKRSANTLSPTTGQPIYHNSLEEFWTSQSLTEVYSWF